MCIYIYIYILMYNMSTPTAARKLVYRPAYSWKILHKNIGLKGGGVQGELPLPGPCTEKVPGCFPAARIICFPCVPNRAKNKMIRNIMLLFPLIFFKSLDSIKQVFGFSLGSWRV